MFGKNKSKKKIDSKAPTAISLFCGAGGCSLGFKNAGYNLLFANDNNPAAIRTYKENFPKTICSLENIDKLNFKQIMIDTELNPGELDILVGGPPCQGFSTAGLRFWDDPRNHLLKSYVVALSTIKPKWFIMENVEGLLTSKKGIYIYEVVKSFIELGYLIRIEKIYSQEYGVPQRRKRVIIVGNLLGHDFQMPDATIKISGQIFRNSDVNIQHAIKGLPPATNSHKEKLTYNTTPIDDFDAFLRNGTNIITDHYYPKVNGVQLERISALMPGQTMKNLPEKLQHESFKKRANRRVADGMPTEKRGGAPSGLKRLHPNEPCLTITGAATREFIHPEENRPLTIRECARIQTFPDSFVFHGNATQKIQQIGNAIPPMLARIFAKHIRDNYGFDKIKESKGRLLGYLLTKSEGMSPALKKTDMILSEFLYSKSKKYKQQLLFE